MSLHSEDAPMCVDDDDDDAPADASNKRKRSDDDDDDADALNMSDVAAAADDPRGRAAELRTHKVQKNRLQHVLYHDAVSDASCDNGAASEYNHDFSIPSVHVSGYGCLFSVPRGDGSFEVFAALPDGTIVTALTAMPGFYCSEDGDVFEAGAPVYVSRSLMRPALHAGLIKKTAGVAAARLLPVPGSLDVLCLTVLRNGMLVATRCPADVEMTALAAAEGCMHPDSRFRLIAVQDMCRAVISTCMPGMLALVVCFGSKCVTAHVVTMAADGELHVAEHYRREVPMRIVDRVHATGLVAAVTTQCLHEPFTVWNLWTGEQTDVASRTCEGLSADHSCHLLRGSRWLLPAVPGPGMPVYYQMPAIPCSTVRAAIVTCGAVLILAFGGNGSVGGGVVMQPPGVETSHTYKRLFQLTRQSERHMPYPDRRDLAPFDYM